MCNYIQEFKKICERDKRKREEIDEEDINLEGIFEKGTKEEIGNRRKKD